MLSVSSIKKLDIVIVFCSKRKVLADLLYYIETCLLRTQNQVLPVVVALFFSFYFVHSAESSLNVCCDCANIDQQQTPQPHIQILRWIL